MYKGKKDAQDAHEAIRPTDASRTPESIAKYLSDEQLKLYRLIWQRFVASQMTPAMFDVTTAKIAAVSRRRRARRTTSATSGSVVRFDGFLKVYEVAEDKNSDDEDESKNKLPNLDGVKHAGTGEARRRAALHHAASALQRSFAGEGAGRARHRAAFDLRVDHQHHSGSRVRHQDHRAVLSHRDRDGGVRPAGEEFPVHLRYHSTRRAWKKSWTTSKKARRSGPIFSTASMTTSKKS